MRQDDDRIVLEDRPERPAAKIGTLVGAGLAVIVAMAILGSFGTAVSPPSKSLPNLTAPPPQPLAVMPELVGRDLIAVVDLLRDAGLDSGIVRQARWLADPDVPAGVALSQSPQPTAEVFDANKVSLVMSAGGPIISWDQVPAELQELVSDSYTPDRTEPVLVVETRSGQAFKTDDLLFGPCDAVELARNTFYDISFDGLCRVSPPETIVGWTPNGAMFAIEGLPPQAHKRTSALLQNDFAFWDQRSFVSESRQAPSVIVEESGIRISGGYDGFYLSTGELEEIANLIEPLDIRGSLILNLTEPMAFATEGMAESDFGSAVIRFDDVDIVATNSDVRVTVNPAFAGIAQVTTLLPTRWSVIQSGAWQYALPVGWRSNHSTADVYPVAVMAAATFPITNPDEWCRQTYPIGPLGEIGPADAFVGVYTSRSSDFNLWLAHFDPDDVPAVSALDPALECLDGIDAEVRTSSRFRDGAAFDVVIGFGSETDDEVRKQAFAILDSFEPIPVYNQPRPKNGK